MEANPYAPPQSDLYIPQVETSAEKLRREHLDNEATIKSVGLLYYLGGFLAIVGGLVLLLEGIDNDRSAVVIEGGVFFVLGIAQLFIAYGLRRLRSWTRIPTLLFSIVGLIAFPIGTLINGYIISKIAGRRGKFVMTPEYQLIISETPHVKRKINRKLIIVLGVLIGLFLILVFFANIIRLFSSGN
ncbi:hypothetical protein EI77_01553 [Prosthecobacter fusiformis]|uniref:Uncharacterized protein n=1 Tax=Prosthecobacter fusiformis TaxID=48464 RepID=A0A4R7S5Z9_9BACT|nr:hypothetical protein [Prosthecobacter fusiformis]TDU73086.1 hypothetical protein EI77_01553 [Prosthecobacter fusiformis]